jgi:hypothetical protein
LDLLSARPPARLLSPSALLDALFEDIAVPESEAARLVTETLKTLSASASETLTDIVTYGSEGAANRALVSGVTDPAYRKRKSRAFTEFRLSCHTVATGLGITWRGINDDEIPEPLTIEDE